MDSNPNNVNLPQGPNEPSDTVVIPEVTPAPPVATKKSRKGLVITGATLLVLLVAGAVVYLLWATGGHKTTASVDEVNNSMANSSLKSAIDDASSSITNSVNSETSLTNTDDSSAANDATNSAASVGDSIDESSF